MNRLFLFDGDTYAADLLDNSYINLMYRGAAFCKEYPKGKAYIYAPKNSVPECVWQQYQAKKPYTNRVPDRWVPMEGTKVPSVIQMLLLLGA